MVKQTRFIIALFSLYCITACKEATKLPDKEAIALVNGYSVSYKEIDQTISQELYDELNRIYLIRKIALDEFLKEKLLNLEASKKKISKNALLDSFYQKKITPSTLKGFIETNKYSNGIPILEHSLTYYDINTPKGNSMLMKKFKDFLRLQYIDSLKVAYNTKILIKPPVAPVMKIENLMVHYKGNLASKVTLLLISDFDCSMCRENYPIFNSLFKKYKDRIRFGYTHFGSYVSISAIASECAAKQGKFWEMYDSIMSSKSIPDTANLIKIASSMNIDIKKFQTALYDKNIRASVENNFYILDAAGIYATPTIMINDKLLFNSSSVSDIENTLNEELSRQ
jgi:hypothetical protein